MEHSDRSTSNSEVSRRSMRLTFRSSEQGVELVSIERLNMITPPQPGERPEAGVHGGHWFELRDATDRVLAHRLLNPTLLNSVEVHDPGGEIRREFGVRDGVFEILLPDIEQAQSAVLVGSPLSPPKGRAKRAAASGEIARFDLSGRDQDGSDGR
jgi:hypothetical protein